jgi:hypothetical protein
MINYYLLHNLFRKIDIFSPLYFVILALLKHRPSPIPDPEIN